jgi:membrane fusion protein (multidrug efflux system)
MADGGGFQPRLNQARARLGQALARARVVQPKHWLLAGAAAAAALIALFVGNWALVGRHMIATDNAYVRADISNVASQITGYVRAVPVADNQAVHAGDVLVEIDRADYEAGLSHARAALAQARGQRAASSAQRAQAAADLARYRPLAQRGMLSPAGMDAVQARSAAAGGDLAAADAAIAAAQAALETAQIDLERTTIYAPIDGVVGDRQVRVGQYVRAGSPLLAVVPLQQVYVVANFKETQIAHMQAGQPVTIRPDVEHGLRLRGAVDSIAPASGAEFSIIPTDTATGNFTKIVQRVPVRIRIAPGQEGAALLRPGLSVSVSVDTR